MTQSNTDLQSLSPDDKRKLLERLLKEKLEKPRSFPLSFAQERLWFIDQVQPGSPAYNIPAALNWPGPLKISALKRTLGEIVRRHRSLRTTFQTGSEGRPIQVVSPPSEFDLRVVDLTEMPGSTSRAEAQRLASVEAQHPFDLADGPLFRALVVRLSELDHLLLLNMHHIVSDGWSMGILLQELQAIYQAYAAQLPSPLPELPIQYTDFTKWQRDHLQGTVLDELLDYWTGQLEGAPLVAELPMDRPRPPVLTYRGAWQRFTIESHVHSRLKEISKQCDATPFMTLLAAFNLLLNRYNGRDQIVVGTPIANRTRPDIEGLIGFFVNTLVLNTDLSADPTFLELLTRVRGVTLSSYAHQELPFERLVEELQPERNLGHQPLVQVLFAFQNIPTLQTQNQNPAPPVTPGVPEPNQDAAAVLDPGEEVAMLGTSKFDLSLLMEETPDGLSAAFEYSTDLFDHTTVTRFIKHFRTLLAQIANNPHQKLSEIRLMDQDERNQVLISWNETEAPEPYETCVQYTIENQAAATPDDIAVTCGADTWTYRQFNEQANRMTRRLRSLGVGHRSRVAVCLEASVHLPAAILSVLKAGAAYVPIDPSYPRERVNLILENAQVAAVIADQGSADQLQLTEAPVVWVDLDAESIAAEDATNLGSIADLDDPIYVIYTSGSTGQPKGAELHHRGFANLMSWFTRVFKIGSADDILLLSAVGFDLTQKNFFAPLMTGGRLHLREPGHFDPHSLVDQIDAKKITLINCTPSAAYALVEATRDDDSVASLRYVFLGGEPIQVQRLWRWFNSHRFQGQVVNTYGPTECTDICAFFRLEDPERFLHSPPPIGTPIPNAQVYVLDRYRQPAPIGVPGELWIGGVGVGNGYVNSPEMTDERFISDPFSRKEGARIYRTGDLVRWRECGNLQFIGRVDHQVKIRGFRIELGEIEATICKHDAVEDAVVIDREGENGERRLVSYIVPAQASAAPVRNWLRLRSQGDMEQRRCFELPNGMAIAHLNRSETEFLYREIYEQETYFQHGITLKEDAVVFDVGANIGLFALFAVKVCPTAKVYAFEPLSPIRDVLKLNCEAYGGDVRIFDFGLASDSGSTEFTFYPHVSILSGRFSDAKKEHRTVAEFLKTQQELGIIDSDLSEDDIKDLLQETLAGEQHVCELRALSQVLRDTGVGRVDLLKVDVEKAELDVLQGVEPADWKRIRQVVVEVHDEDGRLDKIIRLLESYGFAVTVDRDWQLGEIDIYNVYALSRTTQPARKPASNARWRWASPKRLVADVNEAAMNVLPDYMVPASTVLLEALPLSANGKVDRHALPAPDSADRVQDKLVAPRNDVEKELFRIWTDVLAFNQFGINSNFFELGGHSLMATQVISRVRNAFQVDLSVAAVFQAPTIEKLAALVEESRHNIPAKTG